MEAQRVQQESPGRTTPNKTNGYDEESPIDILDMLSKAKEEYEQVRSSTFVNSYYIH